MKKEIYNELSEQSKRFVCEKHGVRMYKSYNGGPVCPFCEREEWDEDNER